MSFRSAPDEYPFLDDYEKQALAQNAEKNPYWFVNKAWRGNSALPQIMTANFRLHGNFHLPQWDNVQAYQALMDEIERRKPLVEKELKRMQPNVYYTPVFLQQHHFDGMRYSEIEQVPPGYFDIFHRDPEKEKLYRDYDLRSKAWYMCKSRPAFNDETPTQSDDFHNIRFSDAEYASLWAAYNSRKDAYFRDFYARKKEILQNPELPAAMAHTPPDFQKFVYGNV